MLMELLDPDVVGYADLGPDVPDRPIQRGADLVARNALRFFGATSGTTLVSHPIDGQPGVLAFRDRQLAAVIAFKTRGGRIFDIHASADPRRFTVLGLQRGQ